MSKYSILFNADRYQEIGPFRFPVYEDLTPGEAKGAELLNKEQSKGTYKSMKLAQKIAQDRKISNKDALEILGNLADDANQDLFFKYADEVEALSASSPTATEQKIAYVTLFMRYRGETKLPPSENWTKTKDWTDEDTEVVPTKVMDKIFEMFLWERDGWPEEGNAKAAKPEKTRES